MTFTRDILAIDADREISRVEDMLRAALGRYKRRGFVIGVSGGVDSSVCAALCARAVGATRVLALHMPERESQASSLADSRLLTAALGLPDCIEELTPMLVAAKAYERRDAAIREALPEYAEGWVAKLVMPSVLSSDTYRLHRLVARAPDGRIVTVRLSPSAYLGIVAASNFKQRIRKMVEYHHADRLNYLVVGTPNRLEHTQGFFVKNGDGAADVKPIAHLYKTQVYALAARLGLPESIRTRVPTTDTYAMEQTQEEFYFSLPYDRMDLCLYGRLNGMPRQDVAEAAGLTLEQLHRVYRDIDGKCRSADYLHAPPVFAEAVTVDWLS